MRSKKKDRLLSLTALLLLAATCGAATFAQKQVQASLNSRPAVEVNLSGFVNRESELVAVEKAGAVNPGEVLHWSITSRNDGRASAHGYKAIGQIPRGTSYVRDSATFDGAAAVLFSIDNGKSFSGEPTVEEKQADGSTKRVPAPVSSYTQIRYEWSDPLAAGGNVSASYKVKVK